MARSVPYGILQEVREMKKVITIGREFGSGGREIGRRIAEKLQIAYYDQEIVTEIANRLKFDFSNELLTNDFCQMEFFCYFFIINMTELKDILCINISFRVYLSHKSWHIGSCLFQLKCICMMF